MTRITPVRRASGHGAGYAYPHDSANGVVKQQYPPDDVVGRDYYRPRGHGAERTMGERLTRLRSVVRGTIVPDSETPSLPDDQSNDRKDRV